MNFPMPHSIKQRLFISLGRNGDILNLLPLIKDYGEQTRIKPALMVGHEFVEILEGVSYVDPVTWRGPWQNCVEAEACARSAYPEREVVNCAVYGIDYKLRRFNVNFQREAWRLGKQRVPWGRLPLVFDRRDKTREEDLLAKLKVDPERPIIATAFSGNSTPFPRDAGKEIIAALKVRCPKHQIVDLSDVKAERIYDLLAILDKASVLVCSDSAPLHLAQACPDLAIVPLVQDRTARWQRSEWLPNHWLRFYYSEAMVAPELIAIAAAEAAAHQVDNLPRLFHVYSYAGAVDSETQRRMEVAHRSWQEEADWTGRWKSCPISRSELTRDTSDAPLNDPGACPFYRDVIELARKRCRPEDIIVYTNADVGCAPGITGWIMDAMMRGQAAFTHRWDSDRPIERPLVGEHEVVALKWYPGSDMWAFTGAWWDLHGHEFPDMAMGREAGDLVLRHLVKNHDGVEIPCCIYHEKHASFWEHHGARQTLPGNIQNRLFATEFLRVYGGVWNDGREIRPC